MKKVIFSLALLITLFLVSCAPVTCGKPYIKVGNSCCLDQNDNGICDNDESTTISEKQQQVTSQIEESSLITKDAAELALYSNEIEGGYSLNRKSSGIYKYDLEDLTELKSTDLTKTFVTSYTKPGTETGGIRWLTFYTRTFETVEGAEKGFQIIKKNQERNTLLEKKEWYLKSGDENAVFLHEYMYGFSPYSKYVGLVRTKNTITQIILNVPAGEKAGQELENYMEKIEPKTLSPSSSPEADYNSISRIGFKRSNLIELKVNEAKKRQGIPDDYQGDYKLPPLAGTTKHYLILNLYLKNLVLNNEYVGTTKRGFDISYYNFILEDEYGNSYSGDYRNFALAGYKEDQILSVGSSLGNVYLFEVLKDSKEFTLTVYDEDVEIYQTDLVIS